jgi:hypothetical protein
MKIKQSDFLNKLEEAVVKLHHENEFELASQLSPVVEALADENFVLAIIIAEIHKLPAKLIKEIRKVYKIRELR